MADLGRVIPLTIWRLLAASIIYGLVACSGSSSAPPPPPPPVPTLVSGTVLVQDSLPRPVADARVEITSGEDAGLFAMTAADGRATIVGHTLTGFLSVRISKPGMSTVDLSLGLSDSDSTRFVTLIHDVLLDLTGEHRLTIEADPLCDLPELARSRTYQASLTPATPWYFNIQLSGASFFSNLDHFATYVNSDAARFEIYLPGFEEEDPMVEQLSPTEYFAFIGEAIGEANEADTITARFQGSIEYCAATPTTTSFLCLVPLVMCQSESHKLILTRP